MVKTSTRAETKRRTRAALLGAGIALFREQGLDGPSLDAICERAGYTRGAFYVHFKDRDDFLAHVMEHVGARFLDMVITAGEGGLARTVERFLAALSSGAYPLSKKGGVRPYQLLDACARSPRVRRHYVGLVEQSIARLAAVIAESQRARTVRKDADAGQVATLLLATVIGAHTMLDLGVAADAPALAQTLLRLLSP